MTRWAAPLLTICVACGKNGGSPFPDTVLVSGPSPYAAACAGVAGPNGVLYANSEVEPWLAINPANPQNLVAVWQQDRWSNGGAKGIVTAASFDSGHTWSRTSVPFTVCAGGSFERASDPWVTFSPDGTAWQIALTFDQSQVNRGILVARSGDGGRSWDAPIALDRSTDPDLATDKETITADPFDASRLYAVWDRVDHFTEQNSPLAHGPAFFSRTIDGGRNWSVPQIIYDPGADAQTIANQIVVLADGTLVDLLMIITQNSTNNPHYAVAILRSADGGDSWSQPIQIAVVDIENVPSKIPGKVVRTGNVVPSIAADGSALAVAWQAATDVVLSRSTDGGLSWSPPARVNPQGRAAFTPVVSAVNGVLAVSYTDLRNNDASDPSQLLATTWLSTSSDGGATWQETQLTSPFDLQKAPFADGFFLGDYQGLVHAGAFFLPLFAAVDGATTDIFFRPAHIQ